MSPSSAFLAIVKMQCDRQLIAGSLTVVQDTMVQRTEVKNQKDLIESRNKSLGQLRSRKRRDNV